MPFYEYTCAQCGHELEALQKMSDAPLTDCPACQQPALQKRISAAGFKLKGSGWYETDFKSKPPKTSSDTTKKEADKGSSQSSDKSTSTQSD